MGFPSRRAHKSHQSLLYLCALLVLVPVNGLAGQGRFEWPEHSENLQSLPADFSADRLRAVMTGFTRALGVRCSHCHVGEEGQPLSEYDFASDDNRNKVTARVMLEMLGSINDYLDEVEPSGPERVNMWCTTCHAGKARPQTLAEALEEANAEGGTEGALARFVELREGYFATAAYDFSAGGVGRIAFDWARAEMPQAALALAERNLMDWPQAAVSHQAMAQVLLATGDRDGAVTHLEHAVELEPDNGAIQRFLEQILSGG